MPQILPLLIIFLIGIVTKNNLLSAAAAIVMFMDIMRLHRFFPILENRGIEGGLLLLTVSLLVPFATGKVTAHAMIRSILSPLGIFAIIGGLLGAYLNSQGLDLVALQPEIIPGILIGIIISVSFFDGVSVGPVMAAGITALLVRLFFH